MAKGGIVTRPTLALIGEAGPEAVVPLGRGGAAMGGNVTVIFELDGQVLGQSVVNTSNRNGGLPIRIRAAS
jgi:phage-related minor tail protein